MIATHPADAFIFARDPQGRSKGLMRIVRRFVMADIPVITVHFNYNGNTLSETLRVVDVTLLKSWSAPVVTETTPQEPAPTPDFMGSTQPLDHRDWADACVAYAAHAASSQPSTAAIRSHMHAWNPDVIMARTHLKSLELSGRVYTDPSPEGRIPAELQSQINASAAHLRKVERAARASLKGRLINR